MSSQAKKCAVCNKAETELTDTLKNCARCKNVLYCSRDCQKADWKSHKNACVASTADGDTPPSRPTPASASAPTPASKPAKPNAKSNSKPRFTIDRPFTAIVNNTWLSTRPEADVYQVLSDIFRLRRDDQYTFTGEVDEGSIYAGGSPTSELRNYRRFLTRATKLDARKPQGKKVLPEWWSPAKLEECVKVARTDKNAMVAYAVEKSGIQEFYGQSDMSMQLRMVGEMLDGTRTAGQSGATMLAFRAGAEGRGSAGLSSMMEMTLGGDGFTR